jgi:hypothetical protein
MIEFNALYHPYFEPPERWLRSMLLFYDTVYSIVPEGAGYKPSPGVAALLERVPEAFVPLPPRSEDKDFDWASYDCLRATFQEIADEERQPRELLAKFDWPNGTPRLQLGQTVSVHNDKMADALVHDLIDLGLAVRDDRGNWLRVDARVADLILAILAERMAANRNDIRQSVSNEALPFAVAASSEVHRGRWRGLEATLASALLTAEIPEDIQHISAKEYLDIRKHYEESREVFHLGLRDLNDLYLVGSFDDPDGFRRQIEEIVGKLSREVRVLQEQRLRQKVKRWVPIVIGGVASVATAVFTHPSVGIAAAGITLSLDIMSANDGRRLPGTYIDQTKALLVGLDEDIRAKRDWITRVLRRL